MNTDFVWNINSLASGYFGHHFLQNLIPIAFSVACCPANPHHQIRNGIEYRLCTDVGVEQLKHEFPSGYTGHCFFSGDNIGFGYGTENRNCSLAKIPMYLSKFLVDP